MSNKHTTAEELFLRIFKFVILGVMSLTLIVAAGALLFAAYQYSQSPKAPAPAQKSPAKSVNIDDFLKQLKAKEPPKEEPKAEEPKSESEPTVKPDPVKYKEEAKKIFGCFRDSNKQVGSTNSDTGDDAIEDFRKKFQGVADAKSTDRGQPFATDVVKFTCETLLHPQVIAYRKANKEVDVFYPALNFHIKAWDAIKDQARQFEEKEQDRVKAEEREEEMRVALSKESAKATFLIAAGAFGLFMAIALYLIIAAIESNLRRISASLAESNELKLRDSSKTANADDSSPSVAI